MRINPSYDIASRLEKNIEIQENILKNIKEKLKAQKIYINNETS